MKKCLIIANCFYFDFKEYLNQSSEFRESYTIHRYSTYETLPGEDYLQDLTSADLIISQNVTSIELYSQMFISSNIKPGAIFIKTEFFRFNGFWPTNPLNNKKNYFLWFPPNEYGVNNFKDYINYQVNHNDIKNNFDRELEKLKLLDNNSDIKIYDLFIDHYKQKRVFFDHWHPAPFIYHYMSCEILKIIGIDCSNLTILTNVVGAPFRFRLILNCVYEALDINYPELNTVIYFNTVISDEDYYNFSNYLYKYLLSNNIEDTTKLEKLFYNFYKR